MMDTISLQKPRIDTVSSVYKFHTTVDVMRLDLVHPVISGNKWYKLKGYLKEAIALDKKTILSFGGAYSNHIVATAAACAQYKLQSIGIIRGEKPAHPSHTLAQAESYGMKLIFLTREAYRNQSIPGDLIHDPSIYLIDEGGYGNNGTIGISELFNEYALKNYTHIVAAVGTGTTLAGLVLASEGEQQITGISVMKNNFSLETGIRALLPETKKESFSLLHEYHFGGYARKNTQLFRFMNNWYEQTLIPSDFVYTGKLFYAVDDLIKKEYFSPACKILVIHSGGLQGNLSLPKGTLIF